MLMVTAPALARLSKKLACKKPGKEMVLRFTRRERGWRLQLDRIRDADTRFRHEGRSVLVLDSAVTEAMTHMTLDVRRTDAGPRLRLRKTRRSGE